MEVSVPNNFEEKTNNCWFDIHKILQCRFKLFIFLSALKEPSQHLSLEN